MAFGRNKEEYDWLNDPFDEKKAARDREQARMSGGTKAALGCGCLLVAIVFIAMQGNPCAYGWRWRRGVSPAVH